MTLLLLAALGAIFLKGFREAVGLAVPIVGVYLVLNVVVLAWGLYAPAGCIPTFFRRGRALASAEHGSVACDGARSRCCSFRSLRSACRASRPASR